MLPADGGELRFVVRGAAERTVRAELGSRVSSIAAINAPYLVRSTPAVAKLVKHPSATKLLEVLPRETGTIGLGWGISGMRAVFSS